MMNPTILWRSDGYEWIYESFITLIWPEISIMRKSMSMIYDDDSLTNLFNDVLFGSFKGLVILFFRKSQFFFINTSTQKDDPEQLERSNSTDVSKSLPRSLVIWDWYFIKSKTKHIDTLGAHHVSAHCYVFIILGKAKQNVTEIERLKTSQLLAQNLKGCPGIWCIK